MDIPFTTYIGGLRQINTAYNMPIMKDLFEMTFGEFNGIDNMHKTLEMQDIKYIVSAAGTQMVTGKRPRRFAGGTNLPPGRYFTVSHGFVAWLLTCLESPLFTIVYKSTYCTQAISLGIFDYLYGPLSYRNPVKISLQRAMQQSRITF